VFSKKREKNVKGTPSKGSFCFYQKSTDECLILMRRGTSTTAMALLLNSVRPPMTRSISFKSRSTFRRSVASTKFAPLLAKLEIQEKRSTKETFALSSVTALRSKRREHWDVARRHLPRETLVTTLPEMEKQRCVCGQRHATETKRGSGASLSPATKLACQRCCHVT